MLPQQLDAQDTRSLAARAIRQDGAESKSATHLHEKALRLITCGSVDDGKSTLIGRLLWDTKSVSSDHADGLALSGIRAEGADSDAHIPEFALLLDGLQAEREQGITIDVAYRYFSTANRSFIVADTPGHEQYTRNMATGCSTADLAIVLVDARSGILEQTRRHATIATLMGVKQLVLVVNKMDLVGYRKSVFDAIQSEFQALAASLTVSQVTSIPVSALRGHNVVFSGNQHMPWYLGPSLLQAIENASVDETAKKAFRFPVQRVSRPDEAFRGYQGAVSGGSVQVGQDLTVWPGGATAKIQQIHTFDGDLASAAKGDAVTLVLDRNIDIARGDFLADSEFPPLKGRAFNAKLVALDQNGLQSGRAYWLKSATHRQRVILNVQSQLDLQNGKWEITDQLPVNSIGTAGLDFTEDAFFDTYEDNRNTGSFILIDPQTNNTIAAGMVAEISDSPAQQDRHETIPLTHLTLPTDLARKLLDWDLAADYRDQIQTQLLPVAKSSREGD